MCQRGLARAARPASILRGHQSRGTTRVRFEIVVGVFEHAGESFPGFVDETLWPEFLELSNVLQEHLTQITDRVIAESIFSLTAPTQKPVSNRRGLNQTQIWGACDL